MFVNKQLEAICGNCKHLDDTIVLTTYPPRYRCAYYDKSVLWTDKCLSNRIFGVNLDMLPPVIRYYDFDELE